MDAQTPQQPHHVDRQTPTAYCVQEIAIVAEVDSRPPTEEEKHDRMACMIAATDVSDETATIILKDCGWVLERAVNLFNMLCEPELEAMCASFCRFIPSPNLRLYSIPSNPLNELLKEINNRLPTTEEAEKLLSLAEAILPYVQDYSVQGKLHQVVNALVSMIGDSAKLLQLLLPAAACRRAVVGTHSPSFGEMLLSISGLVYTDIPDDAQRCIETALAIFRREGDDVSNSQSGGLIKALGRHAQLHAHLTHYAEAIKCYEEAFKLASVPNANITPRYITSMELDYCEVLQLLGREKEAMALLKKMLKPNAPPLSVTSHCSVLTRLAQLAFNKGKIIKAEQLSSQAVLMAAQHCLPGHLVGALRTHAGALIGLGRREEALKVFKLAREACDTYLKDLPAARAIVLSEQGACILKNGDFKSAVPLLEEARSVLNLYPPTSKLIETIGYLARAYNTLGRYQESTACIDEALALCKATLGERSPRYAMLLSSKAYLLILQHDPQGLQAARQALALSEEIEPKGGVLTASALLAVAQKCPFVEKEPLLLRAKRIALRGLSSSLSLMDATPLVPSEILTDVMASLGNYLSDLGCDEEAIDYLMRATKLANSSSPEGGKAFQTMQDVSMQFGLFNSLLRQNRLEEAETVLRKTRQALSASFPDAPDFNRSNASQELCLKAVQLGHAKGTFSSDDLMDAYRMLTHHTFTRAARIPAFQALAELHLAKGEFLEAEKAALTDSDDVQLGKRPIVLTLARMALGRPNDAATVAWESMDFVLRFTGELFSVNSAARRTGLLRQLSLTEHIFFSLALTFPDVIHKWGNDGDDMSLQRRAFHALLRGKGMTQDVAKLEGTTLPPELQGKYDELQKLKREYVNVAFKSGGTDDDTVDELAYRISAHESELVQLVTEKDPTLLKSATEFQDREFLMHGLQVLAPQSDGVLIEFLCIRLWDYKTYPKTTRIISHL